MRILFVCTGNTCRSPMAEAYFNSLMNKLQRNDVTAVSAGLYAFPGGPMSETAQQALAEYRIDGSSFRSRRFSPHLAAGCDRIFAMTNSHLNSIRQLVPECADKCVLLAGEQEIADPFGGSVELYLQVLQQMIPALEKIAESLKNR